MGKKDPVQPPNPLEVAQTDAAFNRIDQYTPTGSLTFSSRNQGIPGSGPYGFTGQGSGGINNVATLELTPELQQLFDSQTQSDQQLLNLALGRQQGFEGGLPDLVQGLDTGPGEVRDTFFDKGSNLLNRQFDRDEDLLRQSLANRGLTGPGTTELGEAAGTELGLFRGAKADAFENLALEATQRGIGAELTNANLRQSNRATQFNELASLLGLQQVAQPGLNNFFTPSRTDTGAGYALNQQGQIANQQAGSAVTSGILEGLFGLGSAGISASDIRLKEDITKVASLPSGIEIYTFRYIGDEQLNLGVMAQQVLPIIPEAVIEGADGYLMVDYSRIH